MFNFKKKVTDISSNEITAELLIPVEENTSGCMGCTKFFCILLFFIFILFKHDLHSENNSKNISSFCIHTARVCGGLTMKTVVSVLLSATGCLKLNCILNI